eukprot:CAMPEP_0178447906 /NCGR_PEP_ID=MMETSP0689_2-20121128/41678_1 /TAXON_ID=160604 /ORGANISM="Amphidinium massartii, Strain CS-259" /LENGTH=69 /DNA_ID=CAMNT_0020073011 /DNA_START=28 /DNA_END=234 /DNA_ORIENTATION=+
MPSMLQAASDAQAQIDSLYQDVLDCQIQVNTGLQINRELWHGTVIKKENITECVMEEREVFDEEIEACT